MKTFGFLQPELQAIIEWTLSDEEKGKVLTLDSLTAMLELEEAEAKKALGKHQLIDIAKLETQLTPEWCDTTASACEEYVAPAKQVATQPKRCLIWTDSPFNPLMSNVHHYEISGHRLYAVIGKENGTRTLMSQAYLDLFEAYLIEGRMLEYTP